MQAMFSFTAQKNNLIRAVSGRAMLQRACPAPKRTWSAALSLMRSRLRLTHAFKISGKIIVASKFSVLKENAAAFDKYATTARPFDRGVPSADPIAVKLLFKVRQCYAGHTPDSQTGRRKDCHLTCRVG